VAFYFNAGLALLAAAASALRGKKYVYGREREETETVSVRIPTSKSGRVKGLYSDTSPSTMTRIAANEEAGSSDADGSPTSNPESVKASAPTKDTEEL